MLTTLLGGTAFAERFGSAPATVVALHGWGRSHADFAQLLAEHPHALALDLPGFGASPEPPTAWSTAEYAQWLAVVLGERDVVAERPLVIGHSFGGRVLVQLAARQPELLGGIILSGVPLYRPPGQRKPPLGFRVVRWLSRRGFVSPARMEAQRRRRGSADYLAARGVMRDVLVKAVNEDYAEQVAALAEQPVQLVWGRRDTVAPLWMAERAAETLGTTPVVAESGHLLDVALNQALTIAITTQP